MHGHKTLNFHPFPCTISRPSVAGLEFPQLATVRVLEPWHGQYQTCGEVKQMIVLGQP